MRPVCIKNSQRRVRINADAAARLVTLVLDVEAAPPARGLNLLFTNDATIRRFNKQFLNHNYSTDVISFPDNSDTGAGDIIISTQHADAYAAEHGIALHTELARYVIHGILHCLGYTDTSPSARRRMFARQESLLRLWSNRRCPLCTPLSSSSHSY